MTWEELANVRHEWGLTIDQMARFIGVTPAAYKRWKTQPNGVPVVVGYAVEGYQALSRRALDRLMEERGIFDES